MTHHLHPDDRPNHSWRRYTDEKETANAIPPFSFQDPVAVGIMFCNALDDPIANRVVLTRLVTPESLPAFGDFADAADFMSAIQDPGYGSRANAAEGDDRVVYFKILSGVQDSYQALEEQIVTGPGVVTLVWREEFGEWRVHAIGEYLVPEEVPH